MFQKEVWTSGGNSQMLLPPIAIVSFIALFIAQFATTHHFDMPLLVGDKTEAMFDLWSLQHFCTGILVGSTLPRIRFCRDAVWIEFALTVLLIALCWEATELSMEAGVWGQTIAGWKAGFEHWSNRLVGDPMMVVSGALLARRFPYAWIIALPLASAWFILNVTSPNSMHIQRLLFG